jgi:nucleoid-associated protein YgaU
MSSLQAHLEQHELLVGALAFRRDCPICRAERVHGRLPSATLVPPRACAAVTAAVLATSAVAPGIAAATDGQGVAAPAPESPPPPQVSEVGVGGGAVAPATGGSGNHDEPNADAARPSNRSAPPEQRAPEPDSAPPDGDASGDSTPTADPEPGGSNGSDNEAPVEPSPSPSPVPDVAAVTQPDDPSAHDTPQASATPTPSNTDTAPAPPDIPERTASERSSTEPANPSTVSTRRLGGSHRPARPSTRRAEEDGHGTRRGETREGKRDRVRATRTTDAVDVAPDEPTSYTVRPGDSLWRIAERHLGPRAKTTATAQEVARLWEINQQRIGTGNPDLIFPGQTLRV